MMVGYHRPMANLCVWLQFAENLIRELVLLMKSHLMVRDKMELRFFPCRRRAEVEEATLGQKCCSD
jgi:hypothetical protein